MKETTFFRSFGAVIALCLFFHSSGAQIKECDGRHSIARPNKSWSPLSGTGLQHALANASRQHFDAKQAEAVIKKQNSNVAVSGWGIGYFEAPKPKGRKLMAKR
ncbi:hypothetical protein [Taibaiella soli]|uniref:Uncharacterized protein n=1 Tax=Taibaiella soli TaxID=1649169 RepID=A0A2W2A784_9BACT|nr:hypothetical protein [Taibaiella soli]PZF71175.1 hypothetical protein DN068_19560 [Taibaiella soli]